MIKADFREIDGKIAGPVFLEGSTLLLTFELNSIFRQFIENNNSREILHAVLHNNLDDINKQMDKNELNEKIFNACVSILERTDND